METCERQGLSSQPEAVQSTGAARVSIAGLCGEGAEGERDSADRIEAAEALDSLRDHRPVESEYQMTPGFMHQIQSIPLVSSALEMYDRSKQSSAIIRVGGGAIETGVRRMCQPIAKRIDVSQLDNFACRQLSNFGYGDSETGGNNLRKRKKDQADAGADRVSSSTAEQTLLIVGQSDRREGTGGWGVGSLVASARERAVAYREDSMRRLRYCLEWVTYATALLRRHMQELRQMLAGLQESARAAVGKYEAALTTEDAAQERTGEQKGMKTAARQLAVVRREMVDTVRKAVGVVSQYAGSVLPGEARRQVRGMILGLPRRWSMVDPTTTVGSSSGAVSTVGSDDHHTAPGSVAESVTPANVEATARRTLAFATESFFMLDGVKSVFGGLQTNAERWWSGSGNSPTPQPVQMEQLEPECSATAYRDPLHSQSDVQHPGSDGLRLRKPPPRRMRPDPQHPSLSTYKNVSSDNPLDKRRSTASLVEIGEQMRRMDMQQYAGSNDSTISAVDKSTSKRSCTREHSPTRESP
ncbi:transcriptional regulator opi1 [Coemansia sp. RSA 988]|nr:transcriptional regulator opi1 [Coemansia sp. RSA 988]